MFRRVTEHLIQGAAAAVDRAATRAVESRSGRQRSLLAVSHAARAGFLERVMREYPGQPSREFFGDPTRVEPSVRRVRAERGLEVLDVTWDSAYIAFSEGIRERYASTRENQLALARLFSRGRSRPCAIVVHGYMSGHLALEERLWPIAELDRLGFDTALFVLPFHGLRGPKNAAIPQFPNTDPRVTIEGFRQAIADLRALIGWLRRRGHARLGLLGMSLGGYTAALTATVEPDLDFLVPLVPLACLADFAREQGSLSQLPRESAIEHELIERAYRVASPLSLPPRIAPERVLVVAARADRVTPLAHARKLASHFGAELLSFRGGHLLQLGRRDAFQRVFDLLRRTSYPE
jgi:pimeloyl-ACP methyl ester carboxylesterase